MHVGLRIKAERIRRGFTQRQLADALGVQPATVLNWEKGYTAPTEALRRQVERLLEIPLSSRGGVEAATPLAQGDIDSAEHPPQRRTLDGQSEELKRRLSRFLGELAVAGVDDDGIALAKTLLTSESAISVYKRFARMSGQTPEHAMDTLAAAIRILLVGTSAATGADESRNR